MHRNDGGRHVHVYLIEGRPAFLLKQINAHASGQSRRVPFMYVVLVHDITDSCLFFSLYRITALGFTFDYTCRPNDNVE